MLHGLLSRSQGPGPHRILDAAVGIGTQLVGLAAHGHEICGTDISREAVRRARAECARLQRDGAVGVADLRSLPFADASFDAVVCADNAVAHLMSGDGVTGALREMQRVTRPGGVLLVSTRDYEQARQLHPTGTPPQVWTARGGPGSVAFQVWDWRADGKRYDLQHFHLVGGGDDWRVARRTTSCWAITRDELTDCARQAGLANLAWLLPAESGFFQPLLMAQVAD